MKSTTTKAWRQSFASAPIGNIPMATNIAVLALFSLFTGQSGLAQETSDTEGSNAATTIQWRSDGTHAEIRVLEGNQTGAGGERQIKRRSAQTDAESNLDLHPYWYSDGTWISDIGTLLYRDRDRDGYFAGISLSLDADSEYQHQSVYVVIDLLSQYGMREHLHTSLVFDLHHHSIGDQYHVDIELVRNYPAASYDLIIDLVDAHDNRVLDTVDARSFHNLAALPLESEDLDNEFSSGPVVTPEPPNDDIRVQEYTGSASWWTLLLALSALFLRERKVLDLESAR